MSESEKPGICEDWARLVSAVRTAIAPAHISLGLVDMY